jgi:hypothetical protein
MTQGREEAKVKKLTRITSVFVLVRAFAFLREISLGEIPCSRVAIS